MNEQIRELARQAKLELFPAPQHGFEVIAGTDTHLAKFAELIVQKCIGTVEGMEPGYKDYRDQIEDAFRRDCVAEIKYQFGIEQ
jgi:hypothetical protein